MASQYCIWDLQLAYPGRALRDSQRHGHVTEKCLPTDKLGYSLMTSGMARRMGNSSRPSIALNISPVMNISGYLDQMWDQPLSRERRRDVAAAAVTHMGVGYREYTLEVEFQNDFGLQPPGRFFKCPHPLISIYIKMICPMHSALAPCT